MSLQPNALRDASDAAAVFIASHINEDGQLVDPDVKNDICYYRTLPLTLFYSGRNREANRVLDFVKANFMRSNGDFRTSDETKSCSHADNVYYHFTNDWFVIGAHLMGRYDIAEPAYDYLKSFIGSRHHGLFTIQGPAAEGYDETDMASAGILGIVALTRGGVLIFIYDPTLIITILCSRLCMKGQS